MWISWATLTHGMAHAALGSPFRFIGVYVITFPFQVGTPVYPLHRLHDSKGTVKVAIGSHICYYFGLNGGEGSVLLCAVF